MGQQEFEKLYGTKTAQQKLEEKVHPQGYVKQIQLQNKLEQQSPFYLQTNEPTIARKPNQSNYASAMEQARSRFEQQLQNEKDCHKRGIEEYQQFVDEANKFQELKSLKESEKKMWVKSLLEKQIQHEKEKRLESQEERRRRAGVSFGPIETEETLLHQRMKKIQDVNATKVDLNDQIREKNTKT